MGFPTFCTHGPPEGTNVGGSPGTVAHDDVDGTTDAAVEVGEEVPIPFLEKSPKAPAGTGV